MGEVGVRINEREYKVACQDGQEAHLRELAEYVDGKVSELIGTVGQSGVMPLLAMAGLLVADELMDSRRDKDSAEQISEVAQRSLTEEREAASVLLEMAARRIDNIAASLEPA